MNKQTAINLLGGTPTKAARAIGITSQAVQRWPDELTDKIRDRVEAALARQKLPSKKAKKATEVQA